MKVERVIGEMIILLIMTSSGWHFIIVLNISRQRTVSALWKCQIKCYISKVWTNVNLNITSINDVKETNLIYTINQTLSHVSKMFGCTWRNFEEDLKSTVIIVRIINYTFVHWRRNNNERLRNSSKRKIILLKLK